MTEYEAETYLNAWGAHKRKEVEDEVGLPKVSPSCREYEAADWESAPVPVVSDSDLDRACWTMVVLKSRHARLYRDMADHYIDGRKLGFDRIRTGKTAFQRVWYEFDRFTQPVSAA